MNGICSSMSIAGLKITLKAYFGFNYVYAGIVSLLIFGILCFVKLKYSPKEIELKNIFTYNGILAIYLTFLIGGTILNRTTGDVMRSELIPFWSYRQYFLEKNISLLGQMIFNVLVFVPWPILFALVFPKMKKFLWGVGSAFLFSVFIETTQLVFKLGMFEFDDMFHNTLGAVMGYLVCILWNKTYKKNRYVDEQGGRSEN